MSAAYFSTVFSQTTGQSFISYLTAMRMQKAKELLRSTNMKLSDIALEIGYNEPNYFSHVFRKTTGMTPKEYRLKKTALRNACTANLRACLLFSSNRVCACCGMLHNSDYDLCGTENGCASRLRLIEHHRGSS